MIPEKYLPKLFIRTTNFHNCQHITVGQPNAKENQRCLEYCFADEAKLNDFRCNVKQYSICQFTMNF